MPGDDLGGIAVAERAVGAAELVEGEAVAHRTVALHVDRLEAGAVGGRLVAQSAHSELRTEAVGGGE